MHYSDQGDFDCGPRHRHVVRTYRFPWVRALLSIALGMALGVFLLLASCGVAFAGTQTDELKAAAERTNSACRDDPKATGACATRDGLLATLKAQGHCWNTKAATPAALWVPCVTVDNALAQCATKAASLDAITRFRDTGVPPRMVVEWGYPAQAVAAVYSGQASSYRGAAYCYTLRNIQDTRRALGVM